jgi:hypothetical protein
MTRYWLCVIFEILKECLEISSILGTQKGKSAPG